MSAHSASNARGKVASGGHGFRLAPRRMARLRLRMPPRPIIDIRRATLADLGALLALEHASFTSDRISGRQWRRHIGSATATVLVSGNPDGIDAAAVVFYRSGARSARLYSLAVSARARGAGLGGALLDAAESDARARGCDTMRLEVRVDNTSAVALYQRRGYMQVARLPHFYEDSTDAWRYVKPLAAAASRWLP